MLKYYFSILFGCFFSLGFSQEPAHFLLSTEELSGANVYDLYQDSQDYYWIATNKGLYKYDYHQIKKIECPEMTSSSLFNLKENKGIYCNNLNGQFFKIVDDSCFLFFEIPKELMGSYIYYNIDNKDQLTIATDKLFQINNQKEVTILFENPQIANYSELYKKKNGDLFCVVTGLSTKLISVVNGKVSSEDLLTKDLASGAPRCLFWKDKTILYERNTGRFIQELFTSTSTIDSNTWFNLKDDMHIRYADSNNFWIANFVGGIIKVDSLGKDEKYFSNSILSTVLRDREGNRIFGTFGEGLVVLPNLNVENINIKAGNIKLTLIAKGRNELFLGTKGGEVFRIDDSGKIESLGIKQNKFIETLEYLNIEDEILVDNHDSTSIFKANGNFIDKMKLASIKSFVTIKNNKYLLATNVGLLLFKSKKSLDGRIKHNIKKVENFKERCYAANYDTLTKTYYAGTSLGLKIGTEKIASFFEQNQRPVLCRDIISYNGEIYIATQENGVLIFNNGVIIDSISQSNGLLSNAVHKILIENGHIYLATDKGFQILSIEKKVLSTLTVSEGLHSNNVEDFEIKNNSLWLINGSKLQKVNLDILKQPIFSPKIELLDVLVNNKQQDTSLHQFSHDQNRFQFNFISKSLKYKREIKYEYLLKGIDDNWTSVGFNDNKVSYKTLPSGEYTFLVRAIYGVNKSETLEYSFLISPPFWMRPYFITFVLCSFFGIVYLIYKKQLQKQKAKAELKREIIESKLIAIQSQMNPHFIFNSLNSIQDLVLQQEGEDAYNYINKFASLVRKVLNFSDQEFISFGDEIGLLNIYLELEKLRFEEEFNYSILTGDIDLEIKIPPMIIQPFVENAIKHGLLHKKGSKKLSIEFKYDNEVLYCIVIDNGIGREKAQEIKNRKKEHYKSFSVRSVKNRFEILKNVHGDKLGVSFVDLYNNEKPIGTKVILKLPCKSHF